MKCIFCLKETLESNPDNELNPNKVYSFECNSCVDNCFVSYFKLKRQLISIHISFENEDWSISHEVFENEYYFEVRFGETYKFIKTDIPLKGLKFYEYKPIIEKEIVRNNIT